jgi:hypothetical protein
MTKGKAYRRKAMAQGQRKAEKADLPKHDPTTTNRQRMEMRKAARAYRQVGNK